jgi:hypothetical protein
MRAIGWSVSSPVFDWLALCQVSEAADRAFQSTGDNYVGFQSKYRYNPLSSPRASFAGRFLLKSRVFSAGMRS